MVPSGDGYKINLTLRFYPHGTKTRPGQGFGVYADNEEGVGVNSAQDLDSSSVAGCGISRHSAMPEHWPKATLGDGGLRTGA